MSLEQIEIRAGADIVPATPNNEPAQVMALMEKALGMGEAGVAALERLVELHDRVQRRSAELQFADALRRFRLRCPTIPRTSEGKILTPDGGVKFRWTYADFEQIMERIQPDLNDNGFAITFDTTTNGTMMTVTGTLRHINGHFITSSFTSPTDSANPGMAPQHRAGGAETFCKRHVVPNLLGLSLTDPELEGDKSLIGASEIATLKAMIDELGSDTEKRFLKYMGVSELKEIQIQAHRHGVRALETMRKKS